MKIEISRQGILATPFMPEKHAGDYTAKRIQQVSVEVSSITPGLSKKVANMLSAIRWLNELSTKCFWHTLQLAVQDAPSQNSTKTCLTSCAALLTYFNHSPLVTTELRKNKQNFSHITCFITRCYDTLDQKLTSLYNHFWKTGVLLYWF